MALTKERASIFTEFFKADPERASKLVELEPNTALAQINAYGYDFTLDEMNSYGDVLKALILAKDKLSDCVAGVNAALTGSVKGVTGLSFNPDPKPQW